MLDASDLSGGTFVSIFLDSQGVSHMGSQASTTLGTTPHSLVLIDRQTALPSCSMCWYTLRAALIVQGCLKFKCSMWCKQT